jgi:hypothetical protein
MKINPKLAQRIINATLLFKVCLRINWYITKDMTTLARSKQSKIKKIIS